MKSKGETVNHRQRIDLWVINCFQSKGLLKIAFEIKVSRSDFLHERNNPDKRQPALMLSNQYYFAAPKGLIKPEEIPPECGLVEMQPDKQTLLWTIKAPMRETEEPTWRFVTSILREAKGEFKHNTLESRIRGYQHEVRNLKDTVKILREMLNRERENPRRF